MKVVYYIPHSSFFSRHPYGRVTHAIGILNGLCENDCDVTVVAEDGILEFKDQINSAVKFVTLPKFSVLTHFRFLFKVNEHVGSEGYLLYRKTILGLIWILFYDILNVFSSKKVISEVNGFIFDYKKGYSGRSYNYLSEVLHKLILRLDTKVYVVNDDLKNKLIGGVFPLNASNVVSIHNGGPIPDFIEFSESNKSELRLVFFGILADYNELELFIQLVQNDSSKRISLEIVGFGSELETLKAFAANHERVRFHGRMSFPAFKNLVKSWNCQIVGIVPMRMGNRTGSLSPIKAFDYMSLGLPIVFSDLCLAGLVENNIHGVEYKNGDLASLREAVVSISDEQRFHKISVNVRRDYHKHTWTSRMKDLIEAF